MQATARMKAAACAAVVALTAAVYWPSLAAGFAGDDFMILHRLRAVDGAGDALRFFGGEFFGYYRPLPFVSHAIDWLVAGQDARQFHLINLLLHLANTVLVFVIASGPALAGDDARRRAVAGAIAAVLFGLHASNHEAVVWISARFDLLATFFGLLGVYVFMSAASGHPGDADVPSAFSSAGGAPPPRALRSVRSRSRFALAGFASLAGLLFSFALLSKESAVTLPIVVAAWVVFVQRGTVALAIRRTAPWLAALAVYAVLRSAAGGVPATGGTGRIPKLIAFGIVLAVVVALGSERWVRLRDWLRPRRVPVLSAFAAGVAFVAFIAAGVVPSVAPLAREKLSVAGFAIFYLLSPIVDLTETPYFLDPGTAVYWIGGAAMLGVLALLAALVWRHAIELDAAWFAVFFVAATLIPISALTEGKRYLYLPSAAVAIMVAILLRDVRPRARALAAAALAVVTAVSAWQISRKVSDWIWAGTMVAEGARLVDDALAPSCGGRVVFLTSPVGVRGVYTHFLYETFELPRGCIPEEFHVLARVVGLDTRVDVRWEGADRIVIAAPEYGGNFVLSRDLRHFDVPLRAVTDASIDTPLGRVQAEGVGGMQRISLTVTGHTRGDSTSFFYYSEGAIRPLRR